MMQLWTLTRRQRNVLLAAAAVSSACGLAIELLLGTLASYLVGNQALSFGVAVGGFLAAMGLGSYLSQFVAVEDTPGKPLKTQLLERFVQVELAIAPASAFLPLLLFVLFVVNRSLWLGLILVTVILGILAGLEVPLLTRMMESDRGVKDALAGVLALDYAGALVGSLAFPVLLLPIFGLFPTAAILGSFPALMVFLIGRSFPEMKRWGLVGLATCAALWAIAPLTVPLGDRLENRLYDAPVVARVQTQYQRIVLTRWNRDVRLYLDGELQFSTVDEYRYHEALVHPAMSASGTPRRVLVMGAGDGLALREVLKWDAVEKVVLLELDPKVVKLASQHPFLARSNENSFSDPRVEIRYGDAFSVAPSLSETFDVIVADFPDPDREAIAKLYSHGFYLRLRSRLTPNGVLVTQASSPFFATKAFACIAATLNAAGFSSYPYTIDVPSFGPWGFVLATQTEFDPATLRLPIATRFLTPDILPGLFHLPADISLDNVEINRLVHPKIVQYQTEGRWQMY
ncbi:polyamine aminopropyltransferase [Geitlerinema sp. CS-897]|nr:polyamine aminopropyltransferase [Geitlerinema sp. CS-897]